MVQARNRVLSVYFSAVHNSVLSEYSVKQIIENMNDWKMEMFSLFLKLFIDIPFGEIVKCFSNYEIQKHRNNRNTEVWNGGCWNSRKPENRNVRKSKTSGLFCNIQPLIAVTCFNFIIFYSFLVLM